MSSRDRAIRVPFHSRSELSDRRGPIFARFFPTDDDRAMVRRIVLAEFTGGTASPAGELLDRDWLTVSGT